MPEYIFNDKTGLYYLASRVFSDKFYGAKIDSEEASKLLELENEYASELEKARCVVMIRQDDLKQLDYVSMLNYCAELILKFRLENKKSVRSR